MAKLQAPVHLRSRQTQHRMHVTEMNIEDLRDKGAHRGWYLHRSPECGTSTIPPPGVGPATRSTFGRPHLDASGATGAWVVAKNSS
jgi:hypothetical protein